METKNETPVSGEKTPLFRIFLIFFKISGLTLGGGAVMLALMEDEFVKKLKWLNEEDFLDVFSLTNSLPGLIAINSGLLIGRKLRGFPGALAAILGVLIPPMVIIILLAEIIALVRGNPVVESAFLGIRAAATALLLGVLYKMGKKIFTHFREVLIAVGTVVLIRGFGINAVLVIFLAALTGLLLFRKPGGDK